LIFFLFQLFKISEGSERREREESPRWIPSEEDETEDKRRGELKNKKSIIA
jgi:hypothetical protein